MELHKDFWDEFGRDLVIDAQGHVKFTRPGREKYKALLGKWGYTLGSIRTVDEFKRTLRRVNALELEDNNKKLLDCLRDPQVPENEKDFIRKLLGSGVDESAHRRPVLTRRKIPVPPEQPHVLPQLSAEVVCVDFKTRKVLKRG